MRNHLKIRPVFLCISLIYSAAFALFYYTYVPLIGTFQLVLIPILLIVLVLTFLKIEWGIQFFVFAFPLINNLPYFFGIYGQIPHAPTALVLFLAFFFGWLLHNSFFYAKLSFNRSLFKPLILFSLIVFVSAIVTFLRYANFFPFLSSGIYELIVNANSVRAGGAIMSAVFSSLNYLTGFGFFIILFNAIKSRELIKKILIILSLSTLISLLFAAIQKYYSPYLGNMPMWAQMNQINATLKDPNSFGVYLSAVFPLLLGLAFFLPKKLRSFPLLLAILTLFVFPLTGSRSGLLAIFVSISAFTFLSLAAYGEGLKKKLALPLSLFVVAVLIILSISFLAKGSILSQRLGWSLDLLAKKASLNTLFTGKLDTWTSACFMTKDYPLTGVGIGAYIVELPNYLQSRGIPFSNADSAENYLFQVISELGLIGILLIFWAVFEILKQIRKSWRESESEAKNRFLLIGILAGLTSFFVNFLFHTYIGSFEVKYTFWVLMALVFAWSQNHEHDQRSVRFGRGFKKAAIILPLFFGTVHLWNSAHSLSIGDQTEKFGWNQNYGLYGLEKDDVGRVFQWTKKTAAISIENHGSLLVLPMIASHPDLDQNPVEVKVFLGNHDFRKAKLLKEITFKRKEWIDCEIAYPEAAAKKILLIFETSRTWQPSRYLKVPDRRELAVGLGEEWFRYPSELSQDKIKAVRTISAKNWEGTFKENLITVGTSYLKFRVDNKNIALRLWVKGQKAFGIGPYINIRLDDSIIGKTMLDEENRTSLILRPDINVGEHVLSIEYTNDIYDPRTGQDRNVFLGDLDLLYLEER